MRRTIPLDRLEGLPAPEQGLATAQVQVRAERFGRNLILETVGGGWWLLVRETLKDPMLWFLLGTSSCLLSWASGPRPLSCWSR